MAMAATMPPQASFVVTIPKMDTRKFKGVIKALGWTAESSDVSCAKRRKTSLELAIEDDLAGRVTHYSSLEELKAKFAHV